MKRLLTLFDEVGKTSSPSLLDQLKTKFSPRQEVDAAFLRLMGYSAAEARGLLEYLYPALAEEVERLKSLMEG